MSETNYFVALNSVDVSEWIERKNGLSYVSWANAWKEVKKRHPLAFYTIYEDSNGYPYHTDGKTCWVKTGVTIPLETGPIEHIECLPVMDFRNASIPLERITSTDVNKSIQRSLTKACARHGLGLYVYAGEDLPESGDSSKANEAPPEAKPATKRKAATKANPKLADITEYCKTLTAGMNVEEKVAWAKQHIEPYAGTISHIGMTDDAKIAELYDHLRALVPQQQ